MNKFVYIPKSIRESIKPLKRGYPKNVKLMVFDCETHSAKNGRAYLLTLYNGKEIKHEWIEEKDNETIPIEIESTKFNDKQLEKTVANKPKSRLQSLIQHFYFDLVEMTGSSVKFGVNEEVVDSPSSDYFDKWFENNNLDKYPHTYGLMQFFKTLLKRLGLSEEDGYAELAFQKIFSKIAQKCLDEPEYVEVIAQAINENYPNLVAPFRYAPSSEKMNLLEEQEYAKEGKPKLREIRVSKVFFRFMDYLFEECIGKKGTFLLYAHNLEFDLSAVMDSIFPVLFSSGNKTQPSYTFTFPNGNTFYIKIYGNKLWWAKIELQVKRVKKKSRIIVIDTFNYFNSNLYRISRELKLKYVKSKRPEFVDRGEVPSNLDEMHELLRYCNFEIRATFDLAQWILDRHKEYDVSISVSIADLASKIFRKKYMREPLPQAPRNDIKFYAYLNAQGKEFTSESPDLRDKKVMTQRNIFNQEQGKYITEECQRYEVLSGVMTLAELNYHGGRASSFIGNLCEVSEVNCYDYNSFYPYAMTQLPPLTKGEWRKVDSFDNEHEGFYEVTGSVKKCKYPIILPYSERFKFVGERKDEKISKAPLVSYEIREALRLKELEIEKIRGYVWIPDENALNPFKDYVEYFFKMKRDESIDSSFRWYYKIQLNSLYGKCIQTNPYPEYVNQPDFKVLDKDTSNVVSLKKRVYGGGLYLPHIASWITSFCRAKLHEDLHKYNALTCSTDSFMTKQQIPLNEIGNELGQLKIDSLNNIPCINGLLLFIRPKLYVYFSESIAKEIKERGSLREYLKYINYKGDQNINLAMKYALHGFRGSINDLLEMYKEKNNDYIYKHFWKTRESIIQKKPEKIRVVENREQKLNIDWENERMLCGLTPREAREQKELCIYPNCFNCAHGAEI